MSKRLAIPTVHLNGSSKDYLMDTLIEAAQAVRDAMVAVQKAAPNMRDFYPQPEGDANFRLAVVQNYKRVEDLDRIYKELLEIFEAVEIQGH